VGELPSGGRIRLRFLVDNDLSPLIAKALEDFEFLEIGTVEKMLGRKDVDDEDIIPWLGRTGTIWITHDKAAKRRHAPALKEHQVTVLWIRGKKLTNFDHLKIVVKVLEQLIEKIKTAHGPIHFRASKITGPTPAVDWAADPRDQPRRHGYRRRRQPD
jgi:predicted nuclease of predicted toxin-antitoxin system